MAILSSIALFNNLLLDMVKPKNREILRFSLLRLHRLKIKEFEGVIRDLKLVIIQFMTHGQLDKIFFVFVLFEQCCNICNNIIQDYHRR